MDVSEPVRSHLDNTQLLTVNIDAIESEGLTLAIPIVLSVLFQANFRDSRVVLK